MAYKISSASKKRRQDAYKPGRGRLNSIRASLFLTLVVAMVMMALIGCSESTPADTPTPTPTATPAATPTATPVAASYPVTVTDLLGRSVQIDQQPTRIVTISPTATEMLYLVGGTSIGRDSSSKYPAEVLDLPAVGSVYSPSIESIAALNPDLVIIEALNQARFLSALGELNTTVIAVRATSLEDIVQGLTLVGEVIDRQDVAAQAIVAIRDRIEAASSQATWSPKILILISDADRNIYAAKPESYPGAVADLLGLENLASGLPDSGPYPGFTLYSGEQAITSEPELILTISPAPPPAPGLSDMLPMVPGYNKLTAVTTGQVYELDPALFLQAQGPRIADAVEALLSMVNEASP